MFFGVFLPKLREIKPFVAAFILTLAVFSGAQNAHANSKYAAFVYDANKGKVLYESNADEPRYPASLTKMMTLYMLFDAMDAGKLTLSTPMKVSSRAAAMPPSKLYLKPGSTISAEDAILALVTKSANDVAVVIAEHLAGSETDFARQMTQKAHALGMDRTTFANASGLPNLRQRTTARDMARLGLSLRENHPRSFRYFSTRTFRYGSSVYRNHNRLLGRVGGVNGIKTGYISASGFNLVTNVEKDDRHLVAVVLGGKTGRSRDDHMAALINRYIGKASTKERSRKADPLLVSNAPAPATAAADIVPPLPEIRPSAQAEIVKADPIIESEAANPPKPQSNPVIVAANSVAGQRPDENSSAVADTQKTASVGVIPEAAKEGWKIQLSATPDLDAAKEMLIEASAKGASVLAKKTPYTETVQTGSSTLYRVRFAGFADKDTAREACDFMKRKKYQCIYLN